MKLTRTYAEARETLNCVEVELSQNCVKMILRDASPNECATYVTDELEKFLIQYCDDMTMTHRELFTLMFSSDGIETRLYKVLGVSKVAR